MGGSLTGSDLWVHAGWTMLHYLWAGALLGLGAWACHVGMKSASAAARYVVALMWLGALAVAPIVIAVWIDVPPGVERPSSTWEPVGFDAVGYRAGPTMELALEPEPSEQVPGCAGGLPGEGLPWHALVTLLPWLWLVGSPLTLAWSMAGLAGAERLRRLSSPSDDRQLDALCRRLARSLTISRDVSIRLCSRIAAPVLVGIVRPVILLPPSLLSGLTPRQLEMILLHELAHVRRYDNLVNFAQRMIESALFFHPAVWLVSRRVRREREHCCDAVVVGRLGDRASYAGTLLVVVRHGLSRARAPLPAVAAAGAISPMAKSDLRSRLHRILGREEETMQISRTLGAGVPVAVLAVLLLVGSLALSSGGAEPAEGSDEAVQPAAEPIGPSDAPAPAKEKAKPRAQGAVRWVNQRNEVVWISLGSEDGLKQGTKLRVHGPPTEDAPVGDEKGAIVVTRILEDHLAEATIGQDRPRNPIMPGDRVYWPDWKGQRAPTVTAPIAAEPDESPGALRKELSSLRAKLLSTQSERDALARRLHDLTDRLQRLTAELQPVVPQTPVMVHPSGLPPVGPYPSKPMVDGLVLAVGPDGLVEVSIGSDDGLHGLRKGQRLDVIREQRGGVIFYVGRIEVVDTQPDRTVCRTLPQSWDRPIRKGDQVVIELRFGPPWPEYAPAPRAVPPGRRGSRNEPTSEAKAEASVPTLGDRPKASEKPRQSPGRLWPKQLVPGLDVDGLVLEVGADRLIEISIGYDDGLRKGQGLVAYRPGKPTIIPLGSVEVVEARPDRAVCRILGGFPHKSIRKGDRVSNSLPGSGKSPQSFFPARESDAKTEEPASQTLKIDAARVQIDASGRITLEGAPVTLEKLPEALSSAVSDEGRVQVSIAAHPDVDYQRIVELLTKCQEAGIRGKFSFTAHPDAREDEPPAVPRDETDRPTKGHAAAGEPVSETLRIDGAGRITADDAEITLDQLREVLDVVKRKGIRSQLTIAVDHDTKPERILEVIDACTKARVEVVRLFVQPDAEDAGLLPVPYVPLDEADAPDD